MHVTKKLMASLIVGLVVTLATGSAFADGQGSVATAKKQTRLVSLTFSPAHLINPVVELTGEFKAHEQWGAALIGGAGTVTVEDPILGDVIFDVWEVGGQLRYYALGDFDHGMQVGAEVLYASASTDNLNGSRVTLSGNGVSVGPFLGYKIATDVGFTFDAQLGYSRIGIGAPEAKNEETGETAQGEGSSEWEPLVNLNVGWSF
jgi:hypothetical protein